MTPDTPDPLVSIVLCTNRGGPYLTDTVRSVLAQTVERWELCIVDDESPDPDALRALVPDDPRISIGRIAHHTVATARNAGCSRARGTYLAFLDDDDLWPPERLERQLGALEGAGGGTVACCGQLRYVDADGRPFGEGPALDTDDAMVVGGFHIGTLLVRADTVWRAGLFNACLEAGEDVEFNLRIGHLGPILALPDIVLDYRRHDGNLTNRRVLFATWGRVVYEQHHQVAALAGDRRTRDALARAIAGLERYQARYALRATRAALRSRHPSAVVVPARAAARSLAAVGWYSAMAALADRRRS